MRSPVRDGRLVLRLLIPAVLLAVSGACAAADNAPAAAQPLDDDLIPYAEALSDLSAREQEQARAYAPLNDPGDAVLDAAHAGLAKAEADLRNLKSAHDEALPAPGGGDLKQRLSAALETVARLTTALKARMEAKQNAAAATAKAGMAAQVMLTGKKPIVIKLVGNQIVPLREPYFKVTKEGYTRDHRHAIQISRVKNGEPLQVATQENGLLTKMMQEANPNRDFFAFLVTADAIDTFRQARRLVASKGFAFFWDTDQDKPFIRLLDQQTSDGPIFGTPGSH